MYSIKTDCDESFTCRIKIQGASLKKAFARLILETDRCNILYKGTIDKNGNCEVKLSNVGNILKEGESGEIKFEVIAEDVYFSPWKDNFNVRKSKSLVAEQISFGKPKINSPSLQVQFPSSSKKEISNDNKHIIKEYLIKIKKTFDSLQDLNENGEKLKNIISEFSNKHNLTNDLKNYLVNATIRVLK